VAILGENMPNWGIAYFAVTTMGAVAVPILPDFHATEIQHILRHAECKAVFVSKRLYGKLEDSEIAHLGTTILLDDFTIVPPRTKKDKISELLEQGSREFAKLREAALRLAHRIPERATPEELAAIVYTSGTMGHSKGVMLTHGNIVSDAYAATQIVPISSEDRLLSILPLPHTYECTLGLVTPIMVGAAVYYLDRLPSAAVLLPAMQKVKPTVMLSVPLVMEKMFKTRIHPQLNGNALLRGLQKIPLLRKRLHRIAGKKLLSTFGGAMRMFCIGGASLAPEVEQFLREAKFPYAIGYGLTETSPLVAGTSPKRTRFRATGPPLPGTSIKILNPDRASGEGEIVIKGPTVMRGYYKDPRRTAETFTDDGWFKTGDLGMLDKDNYLYIKGRLKNMILGPSGKNIYPEEIESTINEFDVVLESLVFQQQHQLVARIHLNYDELDRELSSESLDESQVRARIRKMLDGLQREINARLSSFARIHKVIEQREPFEKTATQKIKRHLYVT
jgi:long-chain acyl-CoA synthetase